MFEQVKIELKAVIELDAPTYMNLKRFMEKHLKDDRDRKELGKFMAILNDYDLDGY